MILGTIDGPYICMDCGLEIEKWIEYCPNCDSHEIQDKYDEIIYEDNEDE